MDELKKIIAKNLVELRKMKKYTQQDLASILQYSDKAISKWEKGESLPDIEVLYQICNLYGVTLDFLTHDGAYTEKKAYIIPKYEKRNKVLITLMAVSFVWIGIVLLFLYLTSRPLPFMDGHSEYFWPIFIWAIPVTCATLFYFNHIWGRRILILPIMSVLIWSTITSIFLTGVYDGNLYWQLYIIGVPCQIAIVLWSQIKRI